MADTTTPDLLTRWADIAALHNAAAVLGWDQETYLPEKGQPARGRTLAALAGMAHDRLCEPALGEAIDAARTRAEADGDAVLAAHAREAARAVGRATAVPGDLARALAETQSRALVAWQQAKAADDDTGFVPVLTELLGLVRQQADAYVAAGLAATAYDALLDEYEPGATEASLAPVLSGLADELAPLVAAAAASSRTIDLAPVQGEFDVAAQEAFAREVSVALGYDFAAGRLDASAHPFTTSFDPADVRITWRPEPDDLRPGLFGVIHETGHALYEQGLPTELAGTPAGGAVSLGVHESQSRLWENLVGRSRGFWTWALPRLHEHLPFTAGLTVDELWPALHTVTPSLIRVEADEATYNLHVVVRFELERALFSGGLEVGDLRGAWDEAYGRLLGVRPTGVADGWLQDIHWSMGAFGYFPTYALGNLIAAQLFDAAQGELGPLEDQFARGEFAPLLGWLRDHVHRHASVLSAGELVERATGRPLTPAPFLAHLRADVAAAYGL